MRIFLQFHHSDSNYLSQNHSSLPWEVLCSHPRIYKIETHYCTSWNSLMIVQQHSELRILMYSFIGCMGKCWPVGSFGIDERHLKSYLKILEKLAGLSCILHFKLYCLKDHMHMTKQGRLEDKGHSMHHRQSVRFLYNRWMNLCSCH